MTLAVVYSNFCGMVVSETRNGVESDYVCDAQGSTIGLLDASGAMTDRWEYWPYGEVITHTGSSVTPLTFLGVIGYFRDVLGKLQYVRARHLRTDLARWLTVDPLWPIQLAYGYARSSPATRTDPSGRNPVCLGACAGCASCAIDLLSVCPPGMDNWAQCASDVLSNLPSWLQWLCGGACAGCAACLAVVAAKAVIPPPVVTIGPILAGNQVICTLYANSYCRFLIDLPPLYYDCIAEAIPACMLALSP